MRRAALAALLVTSCGTGTATVAPDVAPAAFRPFRDQAVLADTAPTSTMVVVARPAAPITSTSHPARATRGAARTVLNWAALRTCESGGDYSNRHNSRFRGAYQFDLTTWASVGGVGDPADASPAEQDLRAQVTTMMRRSRQ